MSRGPGKIQKSILSYLENREQPVLRNKMLWELANHNRSITLKGNYCDSIGRGNIDSNFIKSFSRAILKLEDFEKIQISEEKFRNIEDVIQLYPYKTTKVEILQLRKNLLPYLKKYFSDSYLPPYGGSRYSIAENEIHILQMIKSTEPNFYNKACAQWQKLENRIILILPKHISSKKKLWLNTLIRGRQLFLDKNIKSTYSFDSLCIELKDKIRKFSQNESNLAKKIIKFKDKIIPREVRDHHRLKSKLHTIVFLNGTSTPKLKPEFKKYLLKEEPNIIKSMPKFFSNEDEKKGKRLHFHHQTNFDPTLDKLIDQYIFSNFEFISLF